LRSAVCGVDITCCTTAIASKNLVLINATRSACSTIVSCTIPSSTRTRPGTASTVSRVGYAYDASAVGGGRFVVAAGAFHTVTPASLLDQPALQVPANVPPQLVLLEEHAVHAVLEVLVL
jgi:hypothetical protein